MASISSYKITAVDGDAKWVSQDVSSSNDDEFITRYIPSAGRRGWWTGPFPYTEYEVESGFEISFDYQTTVAGGEVSSSLPVWTVLELESVADPNLKAHYIGARRTSGGSMSGYFRVGYIPIWGDDLYFDEVLQAPSWMTHGTKVKATVSVRRRAVGTGTSEPDISELGPPLAERWTTFWTNRVASAPVITSANGATVVFGDGPASDYDLEWDLGNDDDAVGTGNQFEEDYGGWQVQIRPAPTVGDPAPQWQDVKITTSDQSPPWPYEVYGGPLGADCGDGDTVGVFSGDKVLRLRADPTYTDAYPGLVAIVSPGSWEVRVRTYDLSAWGDYNAILAVEEPWCAQGPNYWPGPGDTGNPWPYDPGDDVYSVGSVSPWSDPIALYVEAAFLPPLPISPVNDVAVEADLGKPIEFEWQFRDPRESVNAVQSERRIRIREVGASLWEEIIEIGDQASPSTTFTYINGTTFTVHPGRRYEWQARTIADPDNLDSDWGPSGFFWGVDAPGTGPVFPVGEAQFPHPGLGCGVNRAFLFRRGGEVPLGEITGASHIEWSRVRDDISESRIVVPIESADPACRELLANARSLLHEVVIFRDAGDGRMERVWEGPITRVGYEADRVEIAARDVFYWVYRRIMRQGYNDAYKKGGGGLTRVTIRSQKIIQNALAYDDPNILPYLTVLAQSNDAKQSRVVPRYSRSAYQHIDDLAAKSGLDYVTVGRRIILWDTHNPIGQLPELRDGDFDSNLIVTEYGAQAANVYVSTNNNGIYGIAQRTEMRDEYGYIEMIMSSWDENDDAGSTATMTTEAREKLEETLTEQAERGISSRWPVPVVVRVPDNSTLRPDVPIGINQLIPGVFVPLRATETLRKVAQMQKLDSVRVIQNETGERVSVILSPAPGDGDPDAEAGVGE